MTFSRRSTSSLSRCSTSTVYSTWSTRTPASIVWLCVTLTARMILHSCSSPKAGCSSSCGVRRDWLRSSPSIRRRRRRLRKAGWAADNNNNNNDRPWFCVCWFSNHQRTHGSVLVRREETRRPNTCSLAERQGAVLGRHCNLSASRLIRHWSRLWGRFGSRACRFPQGREVCCHRWPLHI